MKKTLMKLIKKNKIYRTHSYVLFAIFCLIGVGLIFTGIFEETKIDIYSGVFWIFMSSTFFLIDYNSNVIDERRYELNGENEVKEIEKLKLKEIVGIKIYSKNLVGSILNLFLLIGIIAIAWLSVGYFLDEISNLFKELIPYFICIIFICGLYILNKYFWSKVICVISKDGINLQNDFFTWQEIDHIVYMRRMGMLSKTDYSRKSYDFNYLRICIKDKKVPIIIEEFPFYGLRVIKKYGKALNIILDKSHFPNLIWFIAWIVLLLIASISVGL